MTDDDQGDRIDNEIIVALSDYLDGALTGDAKKDVEANKIATDEAWKAAHAEMLDAREVAADIQKSGIQKARAPVNLAEDVTATIHKRSAGRFFGKKTFGDRVPLQWRFLRDRRARPRRGIGYIMYTSETGSLKVDKTHKAPKPPAPVVDQP